MYCNQCGNIIQDGSVFCSFCGVKHNVPVQDTKQASITSAEAPAIQSAPIEESVTNAPQASFTTEEPIPRMAPNFGATVPVKKEKPPKAERYYTFGHIMLCLSAVALMAIVAGVFAGLYFTAI